MVTGAAGATINRLPVLLLPGDIFARRNVAPVLQQLETEYSQDISVNDTLRPVSRYWDRINRPEQLPFSVMEAMRVLTSPANTGAVTLALPQDVQTEAWDYPAEFLDKRVWHIARPLPERVLLERAAQWIRASQRPLIVAGGGVIYSDATEALARFAEQTGIPVGETQAGKGSLPFDHPQNLGAIGVTGTPGANLCAREADLVIGIGTRYSDFTTASKTAFQNPGCVSSILTWPSSTPSNTPRCRWSPMREPRSERLTAALGSYRVRRSLRSSASRPSGRLAGKRKPIGSSACATDRRSARAK